MRSLLRRKPVAAYLIIMFGAQLGSDIQPNLLTAALSPSAARFALSKRHTVFVIVFVSLYCYCNTNIANCQYSNQFFYTKVFVAYIHTILPLFTEN